MVGSFFVGSSQEEGDEILYDLEQYYELPKLYKIGDRSDTKLLFSTLKFYDCKSYFLWKQLVVLKSVILTT